VSARPLTIDSASATGGGRAVHDPMHVNPAHDEKQGPAGHRAQQRQMIWCHFVQPPRSTPGERRGPEAREADSARQPIQASRSAFESIGSGVTPDGLASHRRPVARRR